MRENAKTSVDVWSGVRLDIAANGFWGGRFERTFLGVRVFNPHAPTNRKSIHEEEKKRTYEQRILEVEHSTFTPLVFSNTGGMAKQCSTFYKRLASRALQTSGNSHTAPPYAGYDSVCHSHCCDQRYSVSGVHVCPMAWLPSPSTPLPGQQ